MQQVGLRSAIDLKWNEFLNLVEPFLLDDVGVVVNNEKWNSLSKKREKLCKMLRSARKRQRHGFAGKRDQDFATLEAAGMKVVPGGKANYLAAAREKTWERMQTVMADQPGGTDNYDRLIELFYDLEAAK